jgi:hypothetical protein
MEGSCSTGQSPQRAVVPVEEEEEDFSAQSAHDICGRDKRFIFF